MLLVPLLNVLAGTGSNYGFVWNFIFSLSTVGVSPSPFGLLSAFLFLVVARSGLLYAREQLGAHLQYSLVDKLRRQCFAALLGTEWRWLAGSRRADHADLLLTDVSRVGVGLHFGLGLLAALVTVCAYLFAAFALSWRMAALALVSGGMVFLLLSGQRKRALGLGRELTVASRALQGNVQESLAGIKLAKILRSEFRHLELFTTTMERLRTRQLQFAAGTNLSRALFQVGGATLLTSYLYLGLRLWHTPMPELLTLVLIFSRLIPQLMMAQQQFHQLLHALPALEQLDALLADCRANAEPESAESLEPWSVQQAVCLNSVSFTYEEREQAALDGVSLSFPARTTTAIMGASGAGKSTLADLLMGLLAPDDGELTVDGVPVTGGSRKSWRRHVAYVPQEVFLFNDSIRSNLLWARPDATEDELRRALERAAADFVFQLPLGLDTVVGDGGVRLSGGERQRIALARALLERPSLLILDEATSALDLANEARIRDAIEKLHGDLTVVLMGHRLPTLEHADQVIVLEAGRVAAQGSWENVRNSLPEFSHL